MIEHGIEGTMPRTSADMKRVDRVFEALGRRDKLLREVRNHLRLNPKPHVNRVRMPSIFDRFSHSRTQQRKPTLRYLTTGRNVPPWPATDILDQENPFSAYRKHDTDIFGNIFKTGDDSNFCTVPMYCANECKCKVPSKMCATVGRKGVKKASHVYGAVTEMNGHTVNEKLTRLQVPTFSIPASRIDLEPDYFNCLKGRQLKENFKRNDFVKMQRTHFFQSLFTGYFQDDIRRRQEQFKLDMWELEKTKHELTKTKKNYESFIAEAHSDSVNLVKEQLELEHLRHVATLELNTRKGAMTGLKSNIYKREYKLSSALVCRDLLLKLSPPTFRVTYAALVSKNKQREKLKERVIYLYTDYCRYNPDKGQDFFLDEAIRTLVEYIDTLGPPKIYFKHSWEIDMVLRKMELDCVASITDLMAIDDKYQEVVKLTKQVSKYYLREKRLVLSEINSGEEKYRAEKLRSAQLVEDTNNELSTFYKQVTCGDPTLETIGLVEVLHQDIFGPSKQKFSVTEMMNQIERELHLTERIIMKITPGAYLHYLRKVKKRMALERDEPIQARRRYRETKSYIKRVAGLFDKAPIGQKWRRVVPRSQLPLPKKKNKTSTERRTIDVKFSHLQVDKICTRDDLEDDIDIIIKCHAGLAPKEMTEMEDGGDLSYMEHSSLRSSVDTKSLEKVESSVEDDRVLGITSSFDILELGYDSDEMLIRQNFKKKQEKGLVEDEPPVLYDISSFDDRFLVDRPDGAKKMADKDRRHVHRPENRANFNQLSWR